MKCHRCNYLQYRPRAMFRMFLQTSLDDTEKMSPPAVRVNTFVEEDEKPHVDPISKIFIVLESILGLNRLPLIGRKEFIYPFTSCVIQLALTASIIYLSIVDPEPMTLMMWSKIAQYFICAVLSFTRSKFMLSFYFKLNSFDTEAACRPKVSTSGIRNTIQTALTLILVIVVYVFPTAITSMHRLAKHFIPLHVLYILEVHYYGHLLSLLIPRLRLINYYIESSLSSATSEPNHILKEFVFTKNYNHQKNSQVHMRILMDLYEVIVEGYDLLIDGIKWQLLVIIITSFVSILGFLYIFSLVAIGSGVVLTDYALLQVGMIVILMAPLFAPCTFGDRVHSEVRKLRELLASKLYENKLDKSGRSVARALLAFTETRDLSFRLLRMLNIDISLPFKFSGLLVTYLIILLQFEKVVHP